MVMKKTYLLTGLLISTALLCGAHEFWLLPRQFYAAVGETVLVEIMVGENFTGERSEGKKNRIVQYVHLANGIKEDLASGLTNDHYGLAPVKLSTPGTHLIAFANTPKFLGMRADSFLLYLKEDGLTNVIQARERQGDTQKRSRELYRRCVKTLIQVGGKHDSTFAVPTGMPLEISPVQNPYGLKPGQTAAFRVLFEQKPLSDALVRYWCRTTTGDLHQEQQRADGSGLVRFRLKAGSNMVSLVRMVPYADTAQADWISYWGSLTFGNR